MRTSALAAVENVVAIAVTTVFLGGSARGQEVLQRWTGTSPLANYGYSIAALDDVDGDGIGDVAIASTISPVDGPHVEIRSTRDGSLLLEFDHGDYAYSIASAGDVDLDGAGDVLLGDQFWVDVVSGKTAQTLLHIPTRDSRFSFGISLAGVGDVDGDGHPDVAAGGVLQGFGFGEGFVSVNSGKDGHVIHEFLGTHDGLENGFGYAIATLGDLDGDGVNELAVGAPGARASGAGFVRIFSLKTFAEVATIDPPAGFLQFGSAVSGCRDMDGDGIGEVIASGGTTKPSVVFLPNQVWAFSGTDQAILAHLPAPEGFELFGLGVRGAGDVNRDGVGDFLVLASEAFGSSRHQEARLYDGKTFLTLYTVDEDAGAIAGVPDVDGDRFDEFLVGQPHPPSSSRGVVTLYAGDDLFLDATPASVAADEDLERIVRTGVPGHLALVALVTVNGAPIFLVVDGPRALDGTGTLESSIVIPPGLSGLTLGYQGFAINARGKLSKTAVESVFFE